MKKDTGYCYISDVRGRPNTELEERDYIDKTYGVHRIKERPEILCSQVGDVGCAGRSCGGGGADYRHNPP